MRMAPLRFPLILTPTPCHRLDRASAHLGIDLWIKRDDLTGFALGGNKGRKLEYLIADALACGADTVVTCGAVESNFVRQLAAACRVAGLECHAAVMAMPFDEEAGEIKVTLVRSVNARILPILGCKTHVFDNADWEVLYDQMEKIAQSLEREGKSVYRVPVGGSSALGAFAFYQAAKEIPGDFEYIIHASSSGSTQVGLTSFFKKTNTKVIGIACDPEPAIVNDFAILSGSLSTDELLRDEGPFPILGPSDFDLRLDYVGPGYGVPSEKGDAAISWLAQTEGIFLDPIYSGKAFSGLLDLVEKKEVAGKVLFWHTGGMPSLFSEFESA